MNDQGLSSMVYGLGRLGMRLDDHRHHHHGHHDHQQLQQSLSTAIKAVLVRSTSIIIRDKINAMLVNSGSTSNHSNAHHLDHHYDHYLDHHRLGASAFQSSPISSMQSISNILYGMWKMNMTSEDLPPTLKDSIVQYLDLSIDRSTVLHDIIRFLHAFNKLFNCKPVEEVVVLCESYETSHVKRTITVAITDIDDNTDVDTGHDSNSNHHTHLLPESTRYKLMTKIISSLYYQGRPCRYQYFLVMNSLDDYDIVALLQDLSKLGVTTALLNQMIISTSSSISSSTTTSTPSTTPTTTITNVVQNTSEDSHRHHHDIRFSKYIGTSSPNNTIAVLQESASNRIYKLLLHLIPSLQGIKAVSIILQALNRMTFVWKDLPMPLRKALMKSISDSLVNIIDASHVDMPSYLSLLVYSLGKLNAPWRELDHYVYIVDGREVRGGGMYPSRIEFHQYDDSRTSSSSSSSILTSADEMDDIDQFVERIASHSRRHDDDDDDDITTSRLTIRSSVTMRRLLMSSLYRYVKHMTTRQVANMLYGLKELGARWMDLDSCEINDNHDDDDEEEEGNERSPLQSLLLDRIEHLITTERWSSTGYVSVQLGLKHLLNTAQRNDHLIDVGKKYVNERDGGYINDGDDDDSDYVDEDEDDGGSSGGDQLLYHYIHLLRNASLLSPT